jgi:FolB domain-containing protein
MDKVIIKDLLVRGIIGVNPDERVNKQDILINAVMYADTRPAAAGDDLELTVNYRTIGKRIIRHVEESADLLVEKLAEDLARLIVQEYGVERVMVRVEKPGALRFAASVGVEIERSRADYV